MTQPEDLHRRIADALARIGSLSRSRELYEALGESLSFLQARALIALLRRRELRVGELAQELNVTAGTISAAVSTLLEKGLVRKYSDPEEHRAVMVKLTRKGVKAAERAEGWSARVLEPAVEQLDPQESATLLASLIKLIQSLERLGLIAPARMCVTCRYFEPGAGRGHRPHYCHLLKAPIGSGQLQIDCPEHERAPKTRLEELWRSFTLESS